MSTVKTTIGVRTRSQTGAKAQTTAARVDVAPEPDTASPRRRYSDVVARRPPNPVQGEGADPSGKRQFLFPLLFRALKGRKSHQVDKRSSKVPKVPKVDCLFNLGHLTL
jgi:hypothetical protein